MLCIFKRLYCTKLLIYDMYRLKTGSQFYLELRLPVKYTIEEHCATNLLHIMHILLDYICQHILLLLFVYISK